MHTAFLNILVEALEGKFSSELTLCQLQIWIPLQRYSAAEDFCSTRSCPHSGAEDFSQTVTNESEELART